MNDLVLLCKSYRNDYQRVVRLAQSVARYNRDQLPFYLSVPRYDQELFTDLCREYGIIMVSDEEILEQTFSCGQTREAELPGNVLQQVVKVEFWRLGLCRNFVIIDSDSYFIRDFSRHDFLFDADTPFTIINEGRHQREWAARSGQDKFLRQYDELRQKALGLFERKGLLFDFAPTPCIWSCQVWQAMYETYAKPRGLNFYDQILNFPCETQWYGEFLLAHPVIRLVPREPLFKVWGFAGQHQESVDLGETLEVLAHNYLGVVEQSNWCHDLDLESPAKRRWERRKKRLLRLLPLGK